MAIQYYNAVNGLPSAASTLSALFAGKSDEWLMTDAERSSLDALLSHLRPACAIEVGTYRAGSLRVLAKHAKRVYSIDIDPSCRERYAAEFPNVEFLVGRSEQVLPPLLARLRRDKTDISFVLIDADHTRRGVRDDINMVLAHRPSSPLYIMIHDSFNPQCRRGIKEADWSNNPHVHSVEVDYVVGRFVTREEQDAYKQMWCGLALAVLLPEPRLGELVIHENESLMYRTAYRHSVHKFETRWNPIYLGEAIWRRLKTSVGVSNHQRQPA